MIANTAVTNQQRDQLETLLIKHGDVFSIEGELGHTQVGMLPEILRVHLAHAILKLYEFGITDIPAFDFVEHPDPAALITAVETLKFLGAVKEGQLTDLGKKIAVLPLDRV